MKDDLAKALMVRIVAWLFFLFLLGLIGGIERRGKMAVAQSSEHCEEVGNDVAQIGSCSAQ